MIARVCARGCTANGGLAPTRSGSSGYADEASLHTDGRAVIASLQCVIYPTLIGNYLEWLGTKVHMKKSEIAGIDFSGNREMEMQGTSRFLKTHVPSISPQINDRQQNPHRA